ncbi:CRISPR-associated protein Csx14 [Pseudothermotoga thermarum]|uniref:CRISPR-associated protein, Csx13 family n=1 Tax=Pseudothermotoga thermarum DSM 5069 TaxID=688269 RepID=F7YTK5_9THEM|nr:CRISPR-associated protein Csx14 [Pseudothermotoga thermarum]AEH51227.1 CRISPR-associated protein, Csx13 family [Pseudothermotoga thermarum DSM 5069]
MLARKKRGGKSSVLIATLGTEPQVVTITLDKLLEQKYLVEKVVVIYTSDNNVSNGLATLKQEFSQNENYSNITLTCEPVQHNNVILSDFTSEEALNALFRTIYKVVRDEKKSGRIVHLSISGGRKVMGVVATVVAQLLFGEEDKLWYLITKNWKAGCERKFHLEQHEEAWLIDMPVIRWSEADTFMEQVAQLNDPKEISIWYKKLTKKANQQKLSEFVEQHLGERERQLLKLVCKGLSNEEIAREMYIEKQTVANHLQNINNKLRDFLGKEDMKINRKVLITMFMPIFESED